LDVVVLAGNGRADASSLMPELQSRFVRNKNRFRKQAFQLGRAAGTANSGHGQAILPATPSRLPRFVSGKLPPFESHSLLRLNQSITAKKPFATSGTTIAAMSYRVW